MTESGLQEVFCDECNASLGYQAAGTEINRVLWKHNRCPERIARQLGLSREDFDHAFTIAAATITASYPDFAQIVEGSHPGALESGWALMRAEIAAGAVLEILSGQYEMARKKAKRKK